MSAISTEWDLDDVLNFEHKPWLDMHKPISLEFPLLSFRRVARGELTDRLARLKVWRNGGLGSERHVYVRTVYLALELANLSGKDPETNMHMQVHTLRLGGMLEC
jgi:hypothetical protein